MKYIMVINVLLNIGKKPSGASRPIIEFCNRLSQNHDILIYKGYNPNKIGFEYSIRRFLGFLLKGKRYYPDWMNCNPPVIIIPEYKENWIRNADITFFRSANLIKEVDSWNEKKGIKIMRVSNIYMLKQHLDMPQDIVFIASSTMVYEKLRHIYPANRIYRVANGVDCNFFNADGRIYEKPKSVGMVFYGGKNVAHKGMNIGFNVMEKIKKRYPGIRFFTAGLKKEKWIPDFVEFINGKNSESMRSFYRNTDILLFPSFEDASPNPPMEAMACGCALVTTDVGGIRDFTRQNESAIICKPGDVNELTEAAVFFIEHPDVWKNVAINGNREIKRFDYSHQCIILEDVFYE
ncbi:MAG TPA: glycosyltransferase family 4 protein, partial [bacterium]|nr:glycosyltransferase family 4 protein [bacterium]